MSSVKADSKVRLLEPLTSFRFIAALMVFQWHTGILSGHLQHLRLGFIGVSFFFVLSGFILTYVYTSRIASGKWSKIKSFYASRLAKLYPVHLLTFLMALMLGLETLNRLTPHFLTNTLSTFFTNLTLTQTYVPNGNIYFSYNIVSWSISDELFFYALFPLLILLYLRHRKTLTLRRLVIAWAVVWAVFLTFLLTKYATVYHNWWWAVYVFPPVRLFDFVSGMILGLIYLKFSQNPDNIFDRMRSSYFTIIEFVVLGLATAAIILEPRLPEPARYSAAIVPFWLLIIFTFAWQKGLFSRVFSYKPFVFLGNISFSFYMVHWLIIKALSTANLGHHALDSFIVSIVLAAVIYKLFEEPNRVRLKTYLEQVTLPPRLIERLRTHIPVPKPVMDEQPATATDTTAPETVPIPAD